MGDSEKRLRDGGPRHPRPPDQRIGGPAFVLVTPQLRHPVPLGAAFSAMATPVVLVLDDVHLLHNRECQAAVCALADHVPAGSQLVLASRAQPPLRLPRLRAEGRITEIGQEDLSLSAAEASLM